MAKAVGMILDFDATDDAVHGKQEGRFFHGYYDHYCFVPLSVFCGERLLVRNARLNDLAAPWMETAENGARHAKATSSEPKSGDSPAS